MRRFVLLQIGVLVLNYSKSVDSWTPELNRRDLFQYLSSSLVLGLQQKDDSRLLLEATGRTLPSDSRLELQPLLIPRVGHSFYKTPIDQAARCTAVALAAGVCHLDVATQYGSNVEIGSVLQKYLSESGAGRSKRSRGQLWIDDPKNIYIRDESPSVLDAIRSAAQQTPSLPRSTSRRGELFLSHKLANEEQSTDANKVQQSVESAIRDLQCKYLDLVSIHSPLTDKERRLATYRALVELQQKSQPSSSKTPLIRAVGVCNYGIGALEEILRNDLPLPVVNQIELSPFNQHRELVRWCQEHKVQVSCAAWSKLSGAQGPAEQWDILRKLAQQKDMTNAQVLVLWSLQKGYLCVPRSSSKSKLERLAIAQNSYGGVRRKQSLTDGEMAILDGLDISYKCGKLGRRDGWADEDVTSPDWEPTDYVS